jgi:hypothetical protein
MKLINSIAITSCLTLFTMASAFAHDPQEHMSEAQSPDCAAMKNMDHEKMAMDHEKMDMKDPVMAAMMKQCMASMEHGHENGAANASDETQKAENHAHDAPAPAATAKEEEHSHQH